MNRHVLRLVAFYQSLLKLYPPHFRQDYLDEMSDVFEMQLAAESDLDLRHALRIAWREIRPLPGLLIAAYLRERRQKQMKTGLKHWFVQPEGSWKELLLAGLPFMMFALPGVFSIIDGMVAIPSSVGIPILIIMALTLIVVGIIGFFVRLPRWSLVYAGAFLTLITLGGLSIIANFSSLPFTVNWGSYRSTTIFLGIHLILLFLLAAGIVWVSGKIPLTQTFHQQVKSDPSLISLLMYGGTLIVMAGNFEDAGLNWYLIAAAIAMMLGVWGFLQTGNQRKQLLALVSGNTIATGLGLAANLFLVEYETLPVMIAGIEVERAVLFIGLMWLTSMVMILLPLAIFRQQSQPAEA